jgi:hypothetical protein
MVTRRNYYTPQGQDKMIWCTGGMTMCRRISKYSKQYIHSATVSTRNPTYRIFHLESNPIEIKYLF